MKSKKASELFIEIITAFAAVILVIGVFTFLKTCPAMEDGSWMACHWAGQAIKGVSVVIAVLSIAVPIVKNAGVKAGLSAGVALNAVLNALIPGTIISTCMMPDMQCNAVTKPGVMVFSCVLAVLSVINILCAVKRMKKESK